MKCPNCNKHLVLINYLVYFDAEGNYDKCISRYKCNDCNIHVTEKE